MKHKTLSTIIILLGIGVLSTISGCGSNETQSSSSEVSISDSSTFGEPEEPEETPVITETPEPSQFDKEQASSAVGFSERESEDSEIGVPVETEDLVGLAMSINDVPVQVAWENNDAVKELQKKATEGPIQIDTHLFGGFEQSGELGFSLPSEDEQTTVEAGDIVLYQSNQLVVFYDNTTWAYTRLGHITDKTKEELMLMLGGSNAHITIQSNGSNSEGASSDAIDTQGIHAHYEELLLQDEDINRKLQEEEMTQLEMNSLADERFQLWDDLLNELWKNVEASLPDGEVEMFQAEKEAWISERETYATESANQYEGGSIQPLIYSESLTEMTKNKVGELMQTRELSE